MPRAHHGRIGRLRLGDTDEAVQTPQTVPNSPTNGAWRRPKCKKEIDGNKVDLFTISNRNGMVVKRTNWGTEVQILGPAEQRALHDMPRALAGGVVDRTGLATLSRATRSRPQSEISAKGARSAMAPLQLPRGATAFPASPRSRNFRAPCLGW